MTFNMLTHNTTEYNAELHKDMLRVKMIRSIYGYSYVRLLRDETGCRRRPHRRQNMTATYRPVQSSLAMQRVPYATQNKRRQKDTQKDGRVQNIYTHYF
jgi:hypothetical protein